MAYLDFILLLISRLFSVILISARFRILLTHGKKEEENVDDNINTMSSEAIHVYRHQKRI